MGCHCASAWCPSAKSATSAQQLSCRLWLSTCRHACPGAHSHHACGYCLSCSCSVNAWWLQITGVVVGEGFRFGYRAKGDTAQLAELCRQYGLRLTIAPLLGSAADRQSSVSSSKASVQAGGAVLLAWDGPC